MNHFLKIRPILTLSSRLKSRQSDPKRVGEALRQLNRANKAQFGELIKKGKRKTKTKSRVSNSYDATFLQMITADAQTASISAEIPTTLILNNPSSEINSNSSIRNDIELESTKNDSTNKGEESSTEQLEETVEALSESKRKPSKSKIKLAESSCEDKSKNKRKSSKKKLETTMAESSGKEKSPVKSKRKSSKEKLETTMAESSGDTKSPSKSRRKSSKEELKSEIVESCEDKPLKRKTPRKVKTAATASLCDESATLATAENEQIADPVADTSRINDYVEESSQPCDVSYSETNENVANASSVIDDESDDSTTSNPFFEYTLLNESKMKYTPDSKYTEAKIISPGYYPYPSVAHILSESMSESSEMHLKRWKDNLVTELGEQEFQVHSESLMSSAKSLRKLILMRLRGTPDSKLNIPPELQGCWESLKLIFPLFPKVKEMGKVTVHPQLKYKGMIDSLVEFRNKLVLVSWKKANKYVPSLEKTYDMPIQCAAYLGAINADPSFPYLVDEALLVMSYTNGMKADVFHVKTDQCQKYWKLWLDRLHTYHERSSKAENTKAESSKLAFGKLNVEEELAKVREENTNLSQPNPGSSHVTPPEAVQSIDHTLVASSNFPVFNDEKKTYSDENFELGTVDQSVFKSCPAVTTILSESKSAASKFILERWKNNLIADLGVEGFEKYQKNLLDTGVSFHKLIQNHLQGNFHEVPPELKGCWDSLQPVFPLITDVKLTESRVVHEKLLYKGVIDCVAKFQNKLVVIDWKKSDKLKSTISMTYDAPLQIAAYIGAINFDSNYPFKVQEGLLVISYVDGSKADVYHLNSENVQKYWEQWLQRLRKYQLEANANCQKINY